MLAAIRALKAISMLESRILPTQPIMTVKEARKLLGSDSKQLPDTQVQELILTLTLMARKTLNINSSKILEGNDIIET